MAQLYFSRLYLIHTFITFCYVFTLYKFKLNKIAARWPAKAVAQFSTPK